MRQWAKTVDIKSIMYEAGLTVEEITLKVHALLKQELGGKDEEIDDIISEFQYSVTEESFDTMLSELYDYADEHGIWLGI